MFGAVFALLLASCGLVSVEALGSPYVEELRCLKNRDSSEEDKTYFRSLHLDEKNGVLYVGGMDVLIRGNANNLSLTSCESDVLRLEPDKVDSCVGRGKSPEYQCRNHIRVIQPIDESRIYICGTNAHHPLDEVLYANLTRLGRHEFYPGIGDGIAKCPFDPDDNSTAIWVTSGNPGDLPAIYSATNAEFTKADTVIFRGDIFDPVSNQRMYNFKRTIKYDSYMLDKPDFVASFEIGEYVFFFFREIAIEYINCGKIIYSRVARVCKSDVGGKNILSQNWVTYLKARLNCSIPGEFPFFFNEIQHVFKSQEDNTFHAVFTTSNNGLRGSAICSFHLKDVERVFQGKFKEQTTSTSIWLPVGKSAVPQPRPGTCVKDTKNLPDSVLNFIRKHPLMDEDVPHDSSAPIFYRKDLFFTRLVVDKVHAGRYGQEKEYTVYYAGTDGGQIYKISRWKDAQDQYHSRLLDVLSVFEDGEPVRAMAIATKTRKSLFVSSDKTVKQVDLHLCSSRYDSCVKCLRDPYCGWDREAGKCRPYHLGLLQDPSEAEHGLCEASTPTQKLIANFGQSVHLPCQLRQDNEKEGVSWFRLDNRRGKRYPIHQTFDKYVLTNEHGLVIIGINESDGGKYDCVLNEKDTISSYHLAIDSHRCSAPNKTADYQKIYSDWCHEFQRYKSALKTWELKQSQCGTCECNGWSSRCRFNEQLYMESGHGGECMDCEGNRGGPHCEVCKENHFFSPVPDPDDRVPCEPCNCDPTGSKSLQCAENGACDCKPGVTGDKCDMCEADYWNFGTLGCKKCGCLPEGCLGNKASCDPATGNCRCKQNVEGQTCDRCIAGHFYIDPENEFGCTPCFCYGHTSECELSGGYTKSSILSDFSRSSEDWTSFEQEESLPLRYDGINKLIGVQSLPIAGSQSSGAYFYAPPAFLGDLRASYNQELTFKLRINDAGPRPDRYDIIIQGGGARETMISLPITKQNNPMPSYEMQDYRFRLHENPEFGWSPTLSSKDFMSILANVSAIKIRGTYVPQGMGFLDEVKLGTARRGVAGPQATWIERCNCPEGYQGQYCQFCMPGYYHENNGGPFARCIPCSCNGHSDICDAESGKCECRDNTDGQNCERCARGFFGNALLGTPDDCQPCPCPKGGACLEIPGNPESPICIECPDGRTGPRCELCKDGFFGDPMGQNGEVIPCKKCDCNDNVDPNAIGNCDRVTGECLRCIDNTDGFNCQQCKSGFFGDALAVKNPGDPPNCQHCQCYPVGTNLHPETFLPICNGFTGDCSCKPHVVGRDCEKCANGYFNIDSGEGCEPCNCDSTGSKNETCHVETGQCHCNEGVTGQRCDTCMAFHYGFSQDGCKPCDCDPTGSTDLQCDLVTGQCPCRDKVEGRKCDRCMENTKSQQVGPYGGEKICEPCDDCYNLVLDSANRHRRNLETLENLLQQIAENPEPVGDDFEYQLRGLQVRVAQTLVDARMSSQNEEGSTLRGRLEGLRLKLEEVIGQVMEANRQIETAKQHGVAADDKVRNAKEVIDRAKDSLKIAQRQLETQGREALIKAQKKSQKFGRESDKMSAIAREAGELAEKLVEDASEITSIAKQAANTSSQAYEMTHEALKEQHYEADQIQSLNRQVDEVGEKLRSVQSLANVALREANEAYQAALTILRQAKGLEIPRLDNELVGEKAAQIQSKAQSIKDEADQLIRNNLELLQKTQDKRTMLEELLERANLQQQEVDRQLADMDEFRNRALNAVKSGNNVLKDAQATLETLKAFGDHVDENRASAKEAMEKVNYIENIIRDSEGKTNEARESLSGADTYANLSLSVAKHAKDIAQEASVNADTIVNESALTWEQAKELSSSVASLEDKIEETKGIIEEKERVAAEDGQLAKTALSKANEAQIKARDAVEKVSNAKKELENIAAILANVQEPEPGLLEKLEVRVQRAEKKYRAADLELRLKELEEAKQRQAIQVRDLERELKYMMEESRNIQEIRNSLPDFCPKNDDLCIEDQC